MQRSYGKLFFISLSSFILLLPFGSPCCFSLSYLSFPYLFSFFFYLSFCPFKLTLKHALCFAFVDLYHSFQRTLFNIFHPSNLLLYCLKLPIYHPFHLNLSAKFVLKPALSAPLTPTPSTASGPSSYVHIYTNIDLYHPLYIFILYIHFHAALRLTQTAKRFEADEWIARYGSKFRFRALLYLLLLLISTKFAYTFSSCS